MRRIRMDESKELRKCVTKNAGEPERFREARFILWSRRQSVNLYQSQRESATFFSLSPMTG